MHSDDNRRDSWSVNCDGNFSLTQLTNPLKMKIVTNLSYKWGGIN